MILLVLPRAQLAGGRRRNTKPYRDFARYLLAPQGLERLVNVAPCCRLAISLTGSKEIRTRTMVPTLSRRVVRSRTMETAISREDGFQSDEGRGRQASERAPGEPERCSYGCYSSTSPFTICKHHSALTPRRLSPKRGVISQGASTAVYLV